MGKGSPLTSGKPAPHTLSRSLDEFGAISIVGILTCPMTIGLTVAGQRLISTAFPYEMELTYKEHSYYSTEKNVVKTIESPD